MRRYATAEDGDAAKNRFDCKHLNKGGAAGYIAKYIAKNIDGYALDGERDYVTDTAAAVTAWVSTWRIPQFHFIGLPSRGAWRECRKIRSVSLADEFDETVERCALLPMQVILPLIFWRRVALTLPATIRPCV